MFLKTSCRELRGKKVRRKFGERERKENEVLVRGLLFSACSWLLSGTVLQQSCRVEHCLCCFVYGKRNFEILFMVIQTQAKGSQPLLSFSHATVSHDGAAKLAKCDLLYLREASDERQRYRFFLSFISLKHSLLIRTLLSNSTWESGPRRLTEWRIWGDFFSSSANKNFFSFSTAQRTHAAGAWFVQTFTCLKRRQ